jgi:hypothetical protein
MAGRRRFFKVGLIGLALLGAGGALLAITRDPAKERKTFLEGVIPAMLAGALPSDSGRQKAAIEQTRLAVETAIAGLSPSAQSEIAQLFALLASKPGQWLAGVGSWDQASAKELSEFLSGWRKHKVSLFQVGYQALHDLITGSYYAEKSNWEQLGYPGPINL